MEWSEYLFKESEKRGMSYEQMAEKAGMSVAAWYVLIKRGDPLTLSRASQIADILQLEKPYNFINLVFKARLLKFLQKERREYGKLTPQIHEMIKRVKEWCPEHGDPWL